MEEALYLFERYMPRGLTGKGCDACRSQRKRVSPGNNTPSDCYPTDNWNQCSLEHPTCSRCRRLQIPCIGVGKQRFKFQSYQRQTAPDQIQSRQSTPADSFVLPQRPSNEDTYLVQALVARLRPSNDLRYWLVWIYGPFVTEIPRHMGRNAALDDAVLATLTIHTEACVQGGQDDLQTPAISAYFRALRTLRTTLDDPIQALSSETLSAIMLLVSAHARIDGQFASFWSPHGKGLLQLLRLRQSRRSFQHLGHRVHQFERFYQIDKYYSGRRDEFDDLLMSMLQMSVLLQSFVNPEVVLTFEEHRSLETSIFGNTYTARGLRSLIGLSELMLEVRGTIEIGGSLEALITRAESFQQIAQAIVIEHYERLEQIYHHPDTAIRLQAIYTRAYGMAISTSGLVACLRRALRPENKDVQADTAANVQRVIESRVIVQKYLPLGASWIGWALSIA